MKRKIVLLIVIQFSATLAMAQLRYQESQARTIEPRTGMVTTPMVADVIMLNNGEKYSETIDGSVVVSQNMISMINEYKNTALATVLNKLEADVMFATLFEVTTNAKNTLTIKVSGYPAKYINFRMAKPEDAWLTNIYNIVDRNQSESGENNIKRQTLIKP